MQAPISFLSLLLLASFPLIVSGQTTDECSIFDPCDTTLTTFGTIDSKAFSTVPFQSQDQYIVEALDPNTSGSGDYDDIADIQQRNQAGVWEKVVYLNYYARNNGNNDTIQYEAELKFSQMETGKATRIEFGLFSNFNPISPTANPTARMVAGANYSIKLQINNLTRYQTVYTVPTGSESAVQLSQIVKGINIQSSTATVKITISLLRSQSVDQSLFTYVTLGQHANLYDYDTQCCESSCPSGTGMDYDWGVPVCWSCDEWWGLVYSPNAGGCECLSGYYESSSGFYCNSCWASLCHACDSSQPDQCITCADNAQLDIFSKTCSCQFGYYETWSSTCELCPARCSNCSSASGSCLSCQQESIRDINLDCACVSGYYESLGGNCLACHFSCVTCSGGSSSCESCDSAQFRTLKDSRCVCIQGYFQLYSQAMTSTCEPCEPQCLTCALTAASCTSCDSNKSKILVLDSILGQTCVCQAGFYLLDGNAANECIQADCNADPFCSRCQSFNVCVQCMTSKNRVLLLPESVCVCKQGYYADADNECQPCLEGCATCRSASWCTNCVIFATSNRNGSCTCPQSTYFQVTDDGSRFCGSCSAHCKTCSNSTICEECVQTFTIDKSGKCTCSDRQVIDSSTGRCANCSESCLNCTSVTTCTKCQYPLFLFNGACQQSCDLGYTGLGQQCRNCPDGCLTCTEKMVCYYCQDFYYIYDGQCLTSCPETSMYDVSGPTWKCLPCNPPCRTCINHPSACTSCLSGSGFLNPAGPFEYCVDECPNGTYANNDDVCQRCQAPCQRCSGEATRCESCLDDLILYQNNCSFFCPYIVFSEDGRGRECISRCPSGFFQSRQNSCQQCAVECETCSGSAKNCTSCRQGTFVNEGQCVPDCASNQFPFHGICVTCSSTCQGCEDTPQKCKECARGYVRVGQICEENCPFSYYYDMEQEVCEKCADSCLTCISESYCTRCRSNGAIPRDGVCVICPSECQSCQISGHCTVCWPSFKLFDGSCVSKCPQGSLQQKGECKCQSQVIIEGKCAPLCQSGLTLIFGTCLLCHRSCKQCKGSIVTCTSCHLGFKLNPSTSKCLPAPQCEYGQAHDSIGQCVRVCEREFFLEEDRCIFGGCSRNYIHNGYGGCQLQTQSDVRSTQCEIGTFLKEDQCLPNCGSGYYPVQWIRECTPCPEGCALCFNSFFCFRCEQGLQLIQGRCIRRSPCQRVEYRNKCMDTCPLGTFQERGKCKRICPDETYLWRGACFRGCPLSLQNADACVDSCPVGTMQLNGQCL